MIPNVYMAWCNRTAECHWCHRPIPVGTPMISVFFWNKGQDGRKWNIKQYFHVEFEGRHCWEEQGLDYLRMNPYVPYVRKRSLELSPENKRKRVLIMKRKCALEQDMRQLDRNDPNYEDRVVAIDGKIAVLTLEIIEYGGIPKSWAGEILK